MLGVVPECVYAQTISYGKSSDLKYSSCMSGPRNLGSSIPLPSDYKPSPHTVLIGRGKFCSNSAGNKHLRDIAASFLDQYNDGNKVEKSAIVSEIVEQVQASCPLGDAFVRVKNGYWWDVDFSTAREKVATVLRDLLADKYRSSSKSKTARWKKSNMGKDNFAASSTPQTKGENHSLFQNEVSEQDQILGVTEKNALEGSDLRLPNTRPRDTKEEIARPKFLETDDYAVSPDIFNLPLFADDNSEWLEDPFKPIPLQIKETPLSHPLLSNTLESEPRSNRPIDGDVCGSGDEIHFSDEDFEAMLAEDFEKIFD